MYELTPKNPRNDQKESLSHIFFKRQLPGHWIDHFYGEKNPGIDGVVDIYDQESNGDTGLSFAYQLRSRSVEGINYCDIKRELWELCKIKRIPLLIILVDLLSKKVYWSYINIAHINNVLKNLNSYSNRLHFSNSSQVGKPLFAKDVIDICIQHHNFIPQVGENQKSDIREINKVKGAIKIDLEKKQRETPTKQLANLQKQQQPRNSVLLKLNKLMSNLNKNCQSYLSFIYFLEPYRTGDDLIRNKIGIDYTREKEIVNYLKKAGVVIDEGGMLYIAKVKGTRIAINKMINDGIVKVNDIMELV